MDYEIDKSYDTYTMEYKFALKLKNRKALEKKGIFVEFDNNNNSVIFKSITGAKPKIKTTNIAPATPTTPIIANHVFEPDTKIYGEMKLMNKMMIRNYWLTGPTGCGKTCQIKAYAENQQPDWTKFKKNFTSESLEIVKEDKEYVLERMNCSPTMERADFLGEMQLKVDPGTGQSITFWKKGRLERAMTRGLDEDGNVIPDAKPSIFLADEIASAPPEVTQVLQSVMEVNEDGTRKLTIEADGGREIISHPDFMIVFTSNTNGRGITDDASALYTQQVDAMDISFLDRVPAHFEVDYNIKAERHILMRFLKNDVIAGKVETFRNAIRDYINRGECSTPFSTRNILSLCKIANALTLAMPIEDAIISAIHTVFFQRLLPSERQIYNEQSIPIFGKDILGAVDKMIEKLKA